MAQIHELMPLVMRDIVAIPKTRHADKYKFRGVDEVLNAIHPILVEHHISLSVMCRDRMTETIKEQTANKGERIIYRVLCYVDVTFWAPDGSHVVSSMLGEGQDYGGDKASNKAMSAGYKYAMFLGLAIPLKDVLDEQDAEQPASSPLTRTPAPPPLAGPPRTPPASSPPSMPPAPRTSPALPADVQTRRTDGQCGEDQVAEIMRLASEIGMSPDDFAGIIQRRGVSRPEDLTYAQVVELAAKLRDVALSQQAKQTF